MSALTHEICKNLLGLASASVAVYRDEVKGLDPQTFKGLVEILQNLYLFTDQVNQLVIDDLVFDLIGYPQARTVTLIHNRKLIQSALSNVFYKAIISEVIQAINNELDMESSSDSSI